MCPTSSDSTHGLWNQIAGSNDPSRLEEAFAVLDRDSDGTIGSSDLCSFFTSCLGQSFAQEEAEAMIAIADLDGNGVVDLREFQRVMTEGITASSSMMDRQERNAMSEMFQVLDRNEDGLLSAEDLKAVMELSGQPVSDEELDAMIAAAGGSREAHIDLDSFSRLMTSLHG